MASSEKIRYKIPDKELKSALTKQSNKTEKVMNPE